MAGRKLLFLVLRRIMPIIAMIVIIKVYLPLLTYRREGKYVVAMAGRSVMDMWFRYWRVPRILNRVSVYKRWPIPYRRYQCEGLFFEYLRVPGPQKNVGKRAHEYGQEMLQSLTEQVTARKYDALLFKFCFADFRDGFLRSELETDERLANMTSLAKKVHELAKQRGMKLLLCNALPSLNPTSFAQELRYRFNKWVDDYEEENEDVVKMDLFGVLADGTGHLKKEYSIDFEDCDSHPNARAFRLLEMQLLQKVNRLK
jgi:hypothetical protein